MRFLRNLCGVAAAVAVAAPIMLAASPAGATPCIPVVTSRGGMTAQLVNPAAVTGNIDATGCDIGVYVGAGASSISNAQIHDANQIGVFNDGANVSIANSEIYNIGNHSGGVYAPNGVQTGLGVVFQPSSANVAATGSITNTAIHHYQKNGVFVDGRGTTGTSAAITGNVVTGAGPVDYIAQNGIQISRGASATALSGNVVSDNIYTQGKCAPECVGSGVGVVSTGILIFQVPNPPKTGTVASSNHAFRNQANVTVIK